MNYGLSPRALIRDDAGRILFLRRSTDTKHWPDEWELPGGKPDPGEDIFRCLCRETLEETGLVIEPMRLIGAIETDLSTVRVIYLVLEAKRISGVLRLSDEHSEARWVAPAQMSGLKIMQPIADALRGANFS
jgi:8-oxo-dGTP pyrophosphatase MutT (NUDIX family)